MASSRRARREEMISRARFCVDKSARVDIKHAMLTFVASSTWRGAAVAFERRPAVTIRAWAPRRRRSPIMTRQFSLFFAGILVFPALAADADRFAHLGRSDPYYVGQTFPKLVTPQWVGEPGVEAVVVLAIDDMRGPDKWENFLRPILDRLKRIDGRAPVSIMTCQIDPRHPHLQTWLKEGVSLECHTFAHPCPLLQRGDFATAKATYDRCLDLLAAVPNNTPVAFRTPCCDSLNTPSPRMFAEIFNKTTPQGRF